MKESTGLARIISSRKHIREFARSYSVQCGKSAGWIEKDIIQAKKINHISLGEYSWLGYDSLTEEQKKTVCTLWTRAEYRKTLTDRRYICILMNKYIFSKVFSEFCGRRCYLAKDVTEELLCSLAGKEGRVIAKPNCKGQGKGVKVLPASGPEELAAAMEFIRGAENYIVEEYITQHTRLAELNPGAVSIIRFYSLSSPRGDLVFAPVLTCAINKSISNGCQDALTAMIDIRTGEVITDAVDQNKLVEHQCHPVTGVKFKGLQGNAPGRENLQHRLGSGHKGNRTSHNRGQYNPGLQYRPVRGLSLGNRWLGIPASVRLRPGSWRTAGGRAL